MKKDQLLDVMREYKPVALVILAVLLALAAVTGNSARPDL